VYACQPSYDETLVCAVCDAACACYDFTQCWAARMLFASLQHFSATVWTDKVAEPAHMESQAFGHVVADSSRHGTHLKESRAIRNTSSHASSRAIRNTSRSLQLAALGLLQSPERSAWRGPTALPCSEVGRCSTLTGARDALATLRSAAMWHTAAGRVPSLALLSAAARGW
jgi:hypothetical protein